MFLCLKLFDRSNILEVPFKKPKASSGTLDAPQVPRSAKTPPQRKTIPADQLSVQFH